eukprot:TRINITY_DN4685_c0_g2_i3.p3 TRINITY_DN4685_c0_g2~~TRINITY_DN4685_c0_g2_i3.p3  ORF type:complete len:196 (+),score=24.59 TRINITY_DN4685_c0_g2_i3:135-722(+)
MSTQQQYVNLVRKLQGKYDEWKELQQGSIEAFSRIVNILENLATLKQSANYIGFHGHVQEQLLLKVAESMESKFVQLRQNTAKFDKLVSQLEGICSASQMIIAQNQPALSFTACAFSKGPDPSISEFVDNICMVTKMLKSELEIKLVLIEELRIDGEIEFMQECLEVFKEEERIDTLKIRMFFSHVAETCKKVER